MTTKKVNTDVCWNEGVHAISETYSKQEWAAVVQAV
jgi:hypothetical protein